MRAASADPAAGSDFMLRVGAPSVFVLLWASGYIVAKFTLGFAAPFTILLLRFAAVVAVMLPLALVGRAAWPRDWRQIGHIAVVGFLLQGVYLGGIYAGLQRGIPAGIMALVMALQPILTATVVGPLLGERVGPRQWAGLLLGFVGVALVLASKIHFDFDGWLGLVFAALAVAGITAATLYQKRFCGSVDWRTGTIVQYAAAAIAIAPISFAEGIGRVEWAPQFLLAMAWIVLVLAVGTYNLFLWLIRKNAAARLTSFLYLVPPVTALAGFFMFGETLGLAALFGMVLAGAGVYLVVRK